MSQKIRLLSFNLNPAIAEQVRACLDAADNNFLLATVSPDRTIGEELSNNEYDMVLITGTSDVKTLQGQAVHLPIISIVDKSDESSAVFALEHGWVHDYVLKSRAGFRRLPLAIRAVLAREDIITVSDRARMRLLTQLKGDYDGVAVLNESGKIVYAPRDAALVLGYSAAELKDLSLLELVHKGDARAVFPIFSKLLAKPGAEEKARMRVLHKDNTWHWYDVTGTNMLSDPHVRGILIGYSNVTKRMQEAVQQDAIYRIAQASLFTESLDDLFLSIHLIISEVMPAGNFYVAIYDAKNGLLEFPYYRDEFDTPPQEPIPLGRGLTEYVIRTGQSLLCDQKVHDALDEQNEVDLIGSPSAIWLGVPLFIGRQVIGVMVVQHYENENAFGERDQKLLEFVSSQVAFAIHRKQTENELRESEARFRGLFENSTIGIYRSTPDGRLLLVNPTLLRISGYESMEELAFIDLSQYGYVNKDEREKFQALLERDGEVRALESTWRKKDGTAIYVRESARVIRNDVTGEVYYEGVVEDISDRKMAELALKEKVIALETLAEIDAEILLTKDPNTLLEMVCRRAVGLLNASKAFIASIREEGSALMAIHAFQDVDSAIDEFSGNSSLRFFNRRASFMIRDLYMKNFSFLMPQTRKRENVRAVIAEAFRAGSDFRAVLVVFDEKPRDWSEDDQQLLKFLAGQVALSLEKTKLLNDAEQRAQNFETLYSLTGEISSRRDLEAVLENIVRSIVQLFSTHCGFIYLYDKKQNNLELTVVRGVDLEPGIVIQMGDGLAGKVAKSKKPKRVDHYSTWRYRNRKFTDLGFSAIIAVPMVYSGELIGVLEVSEIGDSRRKFTDEDMRLLSLFAGQAAGAVFNARLFSQIQQRNEELDRLYRSLGLLIAGISSDRSDLCQKIAEIVVSEFNQSNCCVWLVEENSTLLERLGIAGQYSTEIEASVLTREGQSLIPTAIQEGRIINVGDVREREEYLPSWKSALSELVVPLMIENEVIGAIDLQSAEANAFDANDERIMSLFALRAALILDNTRLIEQTEERNRRLGTLHAIETSITSTLDLRITLNTLIEQVQVRLNVDAATVLLLDQNLQRLEFIAGGGFHYARLDQTSIRVGDDLAGRAALEHEIVYIPDLTRPGPALQFPERIAGEDFVSAFAIPLVAKGRLYGVLELFYRRLVYSDLDWVEYLETLARQAAMAIDGIYVFDQLQQSLMVQQAAQDATIESWSWMLEISGREPQGHGQRVTNATLNLAQRMGIADADLINVYRGALLHDIGKLFLPDAINLKLGPLSEDEWALVHRHPVYAYDLLSRIAPLKVAANIPYCHHEYWDGSGYPRALQGEQIPLEARIFQIIETWDLMQVDLPYRKAHAREDGIEYIKSQAGKKFDPRIVPVFINYIKDEN